MFESQILQKLKIILVSNFFTVILGLGGTFRMMGNVNKQLIVYRIVQCTPLVMGQCGGWHIHMYYVCTVNS